MATDGNYDEGRVPSLVGALLAARRFRDLVTPLEGDSTGARVGKDVLRWGSVVGGAVAGGAVMAIVAL